MKKKFTVVIFTDLDGSLLHRDTFKFDTIKDYIKSLVSKGVIIIPNSSKTEKEIEKFNEELGVNLPFISENGSSIHGLNLITSSLLQRRYAPSYRNARNLLDLDCPRCVH